MGEVDFSTEALRTEEETMWCMTIFTIGGNIWGLVVANRLSSLPDAFVLRIEARTLILNSSKVANMNSFGTFASRNIGRMAVQNSKQNL